MKMYKEQLRKLAPLGILLFIATMLYTVITGGQDCFGTVKVVMETSAIGITPVLVYYVFTAAIFALYGFSFLFKRAASDLYHALPVTRTDLYGSTTLATATWMGVTIVANTLTMLAIYLISGCPFVFGYMALNLLFYFVAAMLVFSATAIGCALCGTMFTAAATAGVILFLPRLVQFVLARGVVASVPIIGWLDLSWWLDPTTNIATGLVVMQSRQMFIPRIVTIGHIGYSALIAAAGLALGWRLFCRRPSELSEKGASGKVWTVITATLLSFVILLVLTISGRNVLSTYGLAVIAVALIVFVVYQLIAQRDWRKILRTAPCFLIAAGIAFACSFAIKMECQAALSTRPAAEEIEYIIFRGHDESNGITEYSTPQLRTIRFTGEQVKSYVSDELARAAERFANPKDYENLHFPSQGIEPIAIKLKGGQTILRTIEFSNIDGLNSMREQENALYRAAVRAFPSLDTASTIGLDGLFTKEETSAITQSLISESQELGLIPRYYYRAPNADIPQDANYSQIAGNQAISSVTVRGHKGLDRYDDNYSIRMETPKTVSMLLSTYNQHASEDSAKRADAELTRMLTGQMEYGSSLNLYMHLFNAPVQQRKVSYIVNFYLYLQESEYDSEYNIQEEKLERDYAKRFMALMLRGKPTNDVSGFFVEFDWNRYDLKLNENLLENKIYLGFDKADEDAIMSLVDEWYAARKLLSR